MKKLRFGTPEVHVPSKYCKGLNYIETDINYDIMRGIVMMCHGKNLIVKMKFENF